jgi:hypothetical protein
MPTPTSRDSLSKRPGRPQALCGHSRYPNLPRQPYDAPCVLCVELIATAAVLVILAHVALDVTEDDEP